MRRLSPQALHDRELTRLLVQAARAQEIAARIELTAINFMPSDAQQLHYHARMIRRAGNALSEFTRLHFDPPAEDSQ